MKAKPEEGDVTLWLKRLQKGDVDDREAVISWARERIYSIASRMLQGYSVVGRWEQADDIAQNATMRLARALEATVPVDRHGLVGLAATQVRRELLDLARKYRRSTSAASNHETNSYFVDGRVRAKTEEVTAEEADQLDLARWEELHQRAASLPPLEREVFQMSWYMGLNQYEIADILNCSTRTVKRRWEAAKRRLAEGIGEMEAKESGSSHK